MDKKKEKTGQQVLTALNSTQQHQQYNHGESSGLIRAVIISHR